MKKESFKLILAAILLSLSLVAFMLPLNTDYDPQRKSRLSAPNFEVIKTNAGGQGIAINIELVKGKAYKHPVLAIWVVDMDYNYIQTLYVVQSVATSGYQHGSAAWGHWNKAMIRRPATLPYWAHKRGIKANDGLFVPSSEKPVADAYSGATPKGDFILQSKSDQILPDKFRILLEINEPFDWNQTWHNNKYPNDADYKTSGQPPVVYEASVDLKSGTRQIEMKPIGYSHYSGKDGSINPVLSSLTTAMDIARKITVILP